MDLNLDSSEKIISIIVGIIAIVSFILIRQTKKTDNENTRTQPNTNTNTINLNLPTKEEPSNTTNSSIWPCDITILKKTIKILFIDDDRGFKIVGILKKMGWENTKILIDVNSLEQNTLIEANVVFVDIQGVGKAMHYSDEGLGLALAIKRRYPEKKVIIYSAQQEGERFHEALQEADYSLPKTAEPIRFEDTIVRVLKNG